MKKLFFNEDGSLIINETIMSQPSFLKIMEDGIVTDQEVEEQSKIVVNLFRRVEDELTDNQKKLVQDLLVESHVLNAIFKQFSIQTITED